MHRLMYVSAAREAMSEVDLNDLLVVARDRNLALGLTGMLVYSKDSFLQVLEGPQPAIDEVFQSICRDARHSSIYVFDESAIDRRGFPNWSMGFRRLTTDILLPEPCFVELDDVEHHVQSVALQRDFASDLLYKFAQL
jgi:hypothetical protein